MERVRQRRYRAGGWRKILGRFEESGLTAQAFCAHEQINTTVALASLAAAAGSRFE